MHSKSGVSCISLLVLSGCPDVSCSKQHKYVTPYWKHDTLPVVSCAQPMDFSVLRDPQCVLCHEAFGIHLNSYS